MLTKILKWGNGQGIHFTNELLEQANLSVGDSLNVTIEKNHSVVLHRIPKTQSERFIELFGDFKGDWKCHEDGFGRDIGKEVVE